MYRKLLTCCIQKMAHSDLNNPFKSMLTPPTIADVCGQLIIPPGPEQFTQTHVNFFNPSLHCCSRVIILPDPENPFRSLLTSKSLLNWRDYSSGPGRTHSGLKWFQPVTELKWPFLRSQKNSMKSWLTQNLDELKWLFLRPRKNSMKSLLIQNPRIEVTIFPAPDEFNEDFVDSKSLLNWSDYSSGPGRIQWSLCWF